MTDTILISILECNSGWCVHLGLCSSACVCHYQGCSNGMTHIDRKLLRSFRRFTHIAVSSKFPISPQLCCYAFQFFHSRTAHINFFNYSTIKTAQKISFRPSNKNKANMIYMFYQWQLYFTDSDYWMVRFTRENTWMDANKHAFPL